MTIREHLIGEIMRMRSTLVAAVIVGLAALFAGVAPGAASTETPFRGSFDVTTSLTPDPTCGGFRLSGTGTGRATHLGVTTISVDECVDFVMEPGRVRVHGSFVMSAANGDQLHVSVDKAGELPGPTGDAHVTGPYEVTGGTGRFVGATGSGVTSTDANVFSPDATVDLVGTLRVGSDR